jgi:hypothetical protein
MNLSQRTIVRVMLRTGLAASVVLLTQVSSQANGPVVTAESQEAAADETQEPESQDRETQDDVIEVETSDLESNTATDLSDEDSTNDSGDDSAKESVRFDDEEFVLAWQGSNDGESTKEYLPVGEDLESWKKLAAIREYPELDDPSAAVAAFAKILKEKYPQSPSSIIENPKTGDVIIDFVVWPADGSFVEFNIFKYSKQAGGGLRAEQYALREYDETEEFLRGLRPVRERLVELMASGGLKLDENSAQ